MDDFQRKKRGEGRPRFSSSPQFRPSNVSAGREERFHPQKPPATSEPDDVEDESLFDESLRYVTNTTETYEQPPAKTLPNEPRRSYKKSVLISLLILVLLAGGAAAYWFIIRPKLQSKQAPAATQTVEEKPKPKELSGNFRIVATGDIITHESVNLNAKKPDDSYDYTPMLSEIKPILAKAATRICHNTVPAGGVGEGITGYPNFNAPTELITGLATSGCNVISLASDHIGDKGQKAIDATLTAIDARKEIVISAGANRSAEEKSKERYFNVGDGAIKFAYFSYTTRQSRASATPFGVNVYNKNQAAQDLQKVRETADFILVSMCWGKEDSGDIQPEQDQIAQELANAGADIVFGHCTHVPQPVKKITAASNDHTAFVYYSLGNALNSQLPIETLVGGMAVVNIDLATKKITDIGYLPTYMHYEWTPAQKAARDIDSRKNLKLYPLDKAEKALAASQNNTTVADQITRITQILSKNVPVKIFKSSDLL